MPSIPTPIRRAATLALALIPAGVAPADSPSPPRSEARKAAQAIRPLPPLVIPDDPPPHEGAMIDIPYTIDPPDILVVEVLEALPGRPITGERLVRPDGTISLGFYGDVHVRGLTLGQAKEKIIHHLREHLNDEALGLAISGEELGPIHALPEPGSVIRHEGKSAPVKPAPLEDGGRKAIPPPSGPKDGLPEIERPGAPSTERPGLTQSRRRQERRARPSAATRGVTRPRPPASRQAPESGPGQEPGAPRPEAGPAVMPEDRAQGLRFVAVAPIDSVRVLVDVTAHNSKVYFVQGDAAVPGRLPSTGKETVLDALNYAGGLVATAEAGDVHLYRPARGGRPARDYPIGIEAILRGDSRANLQIFPDDRLVIGRNAIVKKTVELDRVAAPINSVLNSILQYSYSARSLAASGLPAPVTSDVKVAIQPGGRPAPDPAATPAARRDLSVKEWVDFLWDLSDLESGKTLDEKALREAILKRLATPDANDPRKK